MSSDAGSEEKKKPAEGTRRLKKSKRGEEETQETMKSPRKGSDADKNPKKPKRKSQKSEKPTTPRGTKSNSRDASAADTEASRKRRRSRAATNAIDPTEKSTKKRKSRKDNPKRTGPLVPPLRGIGGEEVEQNDQTDDALFDGEDLVDMDFIPSIHSSKYHRAQSDQLSEATGNPSPNEDSLALPTSSSSPITSSKEDEDQLKLSPESHKQSLPGEEPYEAPVRKGFSVRSSLQRITKSISHSSNASRSMIRNNPDSIVPCDVDLLMSSRRSPVDRTRTATNSRTTKRGTIQQALVSPSVLSTSRSSDIDLPGYSHKQKKPKNTFPLLHLQSHDPNKPHEVVASLKDIDISNLKYPSYVDCSSDFYNLTDASFLAQLPDIFKEMDLTSNSLPDFLTASHLSKLKRLIVDNNRLSSLDLTGLTSLHLVSARNNRIKSLVPFAHLSQLVHLNLSGNPIREGFEILPQLEKLELLYLKDCNITIDSSVFCDYLLGFSSKIPLPSLTHLTITGNPVFDQNVKTFHPLFLRRLRKLLYFNGKETELQRKMIAPAANLLQPKTDREKKRLVSECSKQQLHSFPDVLEIVSWSLENNVLNLIFQCLSVSDLLSASLVNRQWRTVATPLITSRVERYLKHIRIVTGNPASSELQKQMEQWSSVSPIHLEITPLVYFDVDFLRREKVLFIIADEVDDEFFNPWDDLYNQLSFLYASSPNPSFLPFVKYAMFNCGAENSAFLGIDHLLQSIGCQPLTTTTTEELDFSDWSSDVWDLLKSTYEIKSS